MLIFRISENNQGRVVLIFKPLCDFGDRPAARTLNWKNREELMERKAFLWNVKRDIL